MRKTWSKSLFLLLFILYPIYSFGQEGNVIVRQNPVIDSLMQIKLANDRMTYNNQYYTIQLFYGKYSKAQEKISSFKEIFPDVIVKLSFETPNYKVQAGRYKEKLIASRQLEKIKNKFPSAFLLTKK